MNSVHGAEPVEEIIQLVCLSHRLPLESTERSLACERGCIYEILNGIPRFVPVTNYASSFGLQWNTYRTTQLDSHTGLSISHDRLARIAGGSLDIFRSKKVLEVGCGAGRFTELMLGAGAYTFAVDLSDAVDANYQNCSTFKHYYVAQADLRDLPIVPEQFDIVVCIGVVQHTPDPEFTMQALCSQVKPGGLLLMDHYSKNYPLTPVRRWLRSFLLSKNEQFSMAFAQKLVKLLWPIHQLIYRRRYTKSGANAISHLMDWSPVVDYHYVYPQLGEQRLLEWALLDTHDTLTDKYKHLRTAEEIEATLHSFGMINIQTCYAGNGVEVRAWKPGR